MPTKITALIVDDEPLARSYLESCIGEHCPGLQVVGQAANVTEAIAFILEKQPQVAFLDIQMPGGSGFEILKAIPVSMMPRFVFVTAYDHFAIKAVRAGALDYLLKPVDKKDLQATCARLQAVLSAQAAPGNSRDLLEQSIPLNHQTGFELVRVGEIVHLDADNNYTQVHLQDGGRHTSTQTLGNFEKKLPEGWFFRIHRSHIVNLAHLKSYSSKEGGFVEMRNGAQLPVARQRIPDLMHQVSLLAAGKGPAG